MTHPEIYKQDTAGKTRTWRQEIEAPRYRTIAGILGGNLVTSEWTYCIGKQGRTDAEQALFEVNAAYSNKLSREYHRNIGDIQGGAGIKGTRERAATLLHETYAEATVRYFELTPDGVPRFPVVIDFHANGRKD